MNEKDFVPAPLGEAVLFGWPWHGLAIAGSVTLVNGSTKTITQPQSSNAFKIKKPGIPAVSRTPEQLAADSASGELWTDYQLQQGEKNNVIYGKSTGAGTGPNWIGFASDGSCWQCVVNTTAINNATSGTQNLSISIKRFGDFDHVLESYTRSVAMNLADFGFSALPSVFSAEFTSFNLRMDALSESGSRAVLSVIAKIPFSNIKTGEATTLMDLPIAVFSIDFSGAPPEFAFAVVANCTAMIGPKNNIFDDGGSLPSHMGDGGVRPLGGYINSAGNADALAAVWRPKTASDYLSISVETSGNLYRYCMLSTVNVDICIESTLSGAALKKIPVEEVVASWSTWFYSCACDAGGCDQSFGSQGHTSYRLKSYGFDDKWWFGDPYNVYCPIAWYAGYTTYSRVSSCTTFDSVAKIRPVLSPHSDPSTFLPVYTSSMAASIYAIHAWDFFRINANLIVVGHYDFDVDAWTFIEAIDTKGGVHAIGVTAPKFDIPHCAWHPVKNLFDHSSAASRTFL